MKRCLILLVLAGCGCTDGSADKKGTGKATGQGTAQDTEGVKPQTGNNPIVVIKTNKGTIKAELFEKDSPITVANFLKYVDEKHYDNTVFHRVMPNFMIQGGGFTKDITNARIGEDVRRAEKATHGGIKNEAGNGVRNKRGTLAMARTPDPDSATAQFFINVQDNRGLDRDYPRGDGFGYAVFGKVIEGMGVVDKIKDVETKTVIRGQIENVPVEPVIIESIRREEPKK